jgi:hypothetical protein
VKSNVRVRAALTYSGAAGLAIGPFLVWLRPLHFSGFQLNARIFYRFYLATRTHVPGHERGSRPLASAGLVFLILAGLAFGGLAVRRGWLTSLAGALGVVAIGGYLVTVSGANVRHTIGIGQAMGPGVVVALVGAILAVAAGSFGALPPKRSPAHHVAHPRPQEPPRPDRQAAADDWWERTRRRDA